MTDRVTGLTVTLQEPIREDDVEELCNAIRLLRCVIKVEKVIQTFQGHFTENRIRWELRNKLFKVLE
jgi:hypothetical protein